MRIQVELHADDYGTPMLRALDFDGRRIDLVETLDQWYGADYRYVKVQGRDGALYILKFNEPHADWELTMFKRAQTQTGTASHDPRSGGRSLSQEMRAAHQGRRQHDGQG